MTRHRLSTKQREALWLRECGKARAAGRGERPICQLCDAPIADGQSWDVNHEAHKPHWLGGAIDGVSHRRCNRRHNNLRDTPLYAKNERIRQRYMDFKRARSPLPGGRSDSRKKKLSGIVVDRASGEPWTARR